MLYWAFLVIYFIIIKHFWNEMLAGLLLTFHSHVLRMIADFFFLFQKKRKVDQEQAKAYVSSIYFVWLSV